MTARLLYMERTEDVSGVSGTGVVGEAVEFSDGTTVVRWLTKWRSTVIYGSLKEAIAIHGHDGRTTFVERVAGTINGSANALFPVSETHRTTEGK